MSRFSLATASTELRVKPWIMQGFHDRLALNLNPHRWQPTEHVAQCLLPFRTPNTAQKQCFSGVTHTLLHAAACSARLQRQQNSVRSEAVIPGPSGRVTCQKRCTKYILSTERPRKRQVTLPKTSLKPGEGREWRDS